MISSTVLLRLLVRRSRTIRSRARSTELVDCIEDRETSISVFDAQKTVEICLPADRSAESGGQPIALPLIED
jgi:hypothetical protein